MKILIYGAGTIGLTYGWNLAKAHDVKVHVKASYYEKATAGYTLDILDLRDKKSLQKAYHYNPVVVTDITEDFDVILVTVNRYQLKDVLPILKQKKGKALLLFMQNHWDILSELNNFTPEEYILGFPSQVGGGRDGNHVQAIIFDEGTILGEINGDSSQKLLNVKRIFENAGLSVKLEKSIVNWLKVHYLMQSLSAGAILKAGSYESFARNDKYIKQMVLGYREGLKLCESYGINTKKIFPEKMLYYPVPLVAFALKNMLRKKITEIMVKGHMKQGLQE